MHAFCADFLRTNFERANVDPAFRILDDAVSRQLMDAAMDEVLEEAYTQIEQDSALQQLDYGRGVKKVRVLVERLAKVLEERPEPEKWLQSVTDAQKLIPEWMNEVKGGAKRVIRQAIVDAQEALNTPDCPQNYERALNTDIEALSRLLQIDEYDLLRREIQTFKCKSATGGKRGEKVDEDVLTRIKTLREQIKKNMGKVSILDYPLQTAQADAQTLCNQTRTLGELAERVLRRFEEKKAEQSGLTYSDLETRTLRALADDSVAESVRERFDYVFIDEYQDTSDIQEAIVSRIARDDNRFMVGDVKQSIYRFRMAEPRLFIDKFDRYRSGDGGTLIPLTRNFRSKRPILDFVNGVFEQIMTGGDSDILYDDLARLNPGIANDTSGEKAEIHILNRKAEADTDSEIAEMRATEREGLLIAQKIQQMMLDDPTLNYRDFAILTRTKDNAFTPMLPILLAQNIPAYADGAAGYFESLEITLATAMLRLIVNRRNDVDLIAVLHSPVVGLTADDLARIRIASKNTAFVDAAWKYAFGADMPERETGNCDAIGEKLRNFFEMLSRWRMLRGTVALGEMIRSVLDESGFYVYAGALPGGKQRQANLDRLVNDASRFDNEISGSLSRYLKHMENLHARGESDVAHLLGENDDVVRMMTIHKSKGLEFRVVFGAMTGNRFSQKRPADLTNHRDLGIGFSLYDSELRTKRNTLIQAAIRERTRREDSAEEMRVLYVLLTRAREKLVLVGTVSDLNRAKSRFSALANAPGAGESYLEWMVSACMKAEASGDDVPCEIYYHMPGDLSIPDSLEQKTDVRALFEEITHSPERFEDAQIDENLEWSYPNADETGKPLKLTVSGLLRTVQGPEALPELMQHPEFMADESPERMTAAERGTAFHRALQLLDLKALRNMRGGELINGIREMLNAAEKRKRISSAQREVVSVKKVAEFLESDLGVRLRNAETVRREWPFNVFMRASEALTEEEAGRYGNEEILVQGTIDCCFLEGDEWVLLDYKTNRADDPEALREYYQKQIDAYALALNRITQKNVKEKYLCLLNADLSIRM